MADKTELRARLEFRKSALTELRKAYIALIEGRVQSYTIDDRTLTRLNLVSMKNEIEKLENEVDQLESMLKGRGARKAFGVVPFDW